MNKIKKYFGKLFYKWGCRILNHPATKIGDTRCRWCDTLIPDAKMTLQPEAIERLYRNTYSKPDTYKLRKIKEMDDAFAKTDKQLGNIYKEYGVKDE